MAGPNAVATGYGNSGSNNLPVGGFTRGSGTQPTTEERLRGQPTALEQTWGLQTPTRNNGSVDAQYKAEDLASLTPAELQERNTKMLRALKPYVDKEDFIGFWKTAQRFGDPLAELALEFHASLYGGSLGTRYAISKLELAKTGGDTRLPPDELKKLKKEVGIGVMKAHYDKLKIDIKRSEGEIPGVLSVKQIQDYHEGYFKEIGLPPNAYGGSGAPDFIETWVYCGACDPKP